MSVRNTPLLDANYGELSCYVMNGPINEDFLIKCNPLHQYGVGCFCSEQCHIRQQIRMLYQQNVAIYTAELNDVQWRWTCLDKEIIDDQLAAYEKTFKEQLIGKRTTEEVHSALWALEEKIAAFFEVIYRLIASMADHQNFYYAVQTHLVEEANTFFDVFEQTKRLMQDFLARTVCVTNIDLVMTLTLCFNLKLRLLIPSNVAVKASACPFVIKSLARDSATLNVPGAVEQHVYDYGPITPDFENFYLKPAAESYDLCVRGVVHVAEANVKKRGGKRLKKEAVDNSICPLKRNVRDFVPSNPNSALKADFSKIRLEAISKEEQELRKRMAKSNESPPIPTRTLGKDLGVVEKSLGKIKRRISGNKTRTQAAAACVEPKIEEEKQLVAELLHYIVVTVEIQFPGLTFNFYKKIKVPVAVASNANQRPEGYGSAIWNLIVWLEEANKHNFQWDWPEPYGGAVQREVSDANYPIDHQYFVETYLNGLITVLARVKLGESKKKVSGGNPVDEEEFADSPMSVETFLSDEDLLDIRDDLIDPEYLNSLELNPFPSDTVPLPVRRTPKHLNAIQLQFLSTKLLTFSSSNGFVTRASFLGSLKNTQKSFFYWFFFTCQAIGKNFGIKPKTSNWFGDPVKSVWHSNYVIGYIDESQADATLKSFSGVNHLLLIRFSGSERQSVVIHMISGRYGPVQRSPVAVGSAESLETILRNPLFTPNYKIITWDSQGQLILHPIAEFHDWVAQATGSGDNSQTNTTSTARSGCLSPPPDPESKNPYTKAGAYDRIKVESTFHTLMAEMKIEQNAAKDLCDLLTDVKLSNEESDSLEGAETRKKLREILSVSPELLRLLKSCADKSVTPE